MSKRDYSFEALAEVTGADITKLTKTERGRINAALGELREHNDDDYLLATAIYDKAKVYHSLYPEMPVTPQALTGQWSSLEAQAEAKRVEQKTMTNVYAPSTCETCDGDHIVFLEVPDGIGDLTAACPDCNTADTGFWRYDGTHSTKLQPDEVRSRLVRSEE